jgi:hypothetical protein
VEWISTRSRAGADLGESIRNSMRAAYAKGGVEWVLLGGDSDVIPARYGHVTFGTGDPLIPTDMYYACLDGTWNADGDSLWGEAWHSLYDPGDNADLYAEVYLGRMPASTLAEASILVDKSIGYETPEEIASKRKFLMLAEVIFPVPYNPPQTIVLDGAEVSNEIYELYLAMDPWVVTTRLYENYAAYPGSLPLTKERSIDSLDAGTNHVLHVGHGYSYNMSVGDGTILNYDASQLANGGSLFSMYLLNCTNCAFDTDCLAESFLLNPSGGAFAATGATRSAYPSASRPVLEEYYRLLYARGVVRLGELFTRSRLPYTPTSLGETADRWTHFIYNYFGDPEAMMFRGTPKTLAVTAPPSLLFGPNVVAIRVESGGLALDSAFVCLYKGGDDYVYGYTDPSGEITFGDFTVKSAGSVALTVTARDHARHEGSIAVAQTGSAYLRVSDRTVQDVIVGNGDGVLDGGETVRLLVRLKNTGLAAATGISAVLRSSDPAVTVTDSTALYPSISPGNEAWGSDPFAFSVSAAVPDGHTIEFSLAASASGDGPWRDRFAFEAHCPALEIYVCSAKDTLPYGDNDGVIEEGESFLLRIALKNFGTGSARGLSGIVRSLDPDIVVTDSTSTYGEVPLLGVSFGSGYVLSETSIGDTNYYRFEVTDFYGRTFAKRMELERPGAPTGVVLNSTFGPTEMHVTWRAPDALERYRYRVYRALAAGGPFGLVTPDHVGHTMFTDAGLLPSTRYYYAISTVDSCGNESPPSDVVTGTTNPPAQAGWPLKVAKETASSVKVGDIDGDTRADIVIGSNRVYAWHADGMELRDGDGQPLSWGVFSPLGDNFTATVALANLDGVPGLEIIAASWNTREIYIFNKDGAVLPGWPKSTAYLCWASPVIGDLDGDGDLEIVAYDRSGVVYAWHHDGTELRDGDANPATNGPFFVTKNPGTWHFSTPALADVDADGVVELIVCSPADSIYCLNVDGSRVPGWPVPVADAGATITASPAVGDIDGDGNMEVIVPSSSGRIYGLNHDGTSMAGWPKWVYMNTSTIAPSPALADLDGDGLLEVVIAGLDGKCYVFRHNGAAYPGWPQPYTSLSSGRTESSPVIADIDGDRSLDIILACEEGRLNAWRSNGQTIAGFPIETHAFLRGTPVLHDIDRDGDVELITSCWNTNIYVWDLDGEWYDGFAQWNGFRANIYNSGWKEFNAATGAGGEEEMPVAAALELAQNYPNPFNPTTTIPFTVPGGAYAMRRVRIAVYDVSGAVVRVLADGMMRGGRGEVVWDGRNARGQKAASGVYFIHLSSGPFEISRKMVLLR